MLTTILRHARGGGVRTFMGLVLVVLAACGGGGGGGGDSGPTEPPLQMQFQPGTVEASTYEGESVAVPLRATISPSVGLSAQLSVTSTDGVITEDVKFDRFDPTKATYDITMKVSPLLKPGTYTGDLVVRVCNDTATCDGPVNEMPTFKVPYRFVVHNVTNFTPLPRVSGLDTWSTYQGNAAHDGHVDAILDPKTFVRRFIGPESSYGVVAEGGRFFVVSVDHQNHLRLSAWRESDGSEVWHYDLPGGSVSDVSAPAASAGRVFVTSSDDESYAWTFDAATGEVLAKTAIVKDSFPNFPATVFNGAAYSEIDDVGRLARFDVSTGANRWVTDFASARFISWTPAVDDQGVYVYDVKHLRVIDPGTGRVMYSIADPSGGGWAAEGGGPVLDGHGRVFLVDSRTRLVAFSLTDRKVIWSVRDQFVSDIAVAGDTVYGINGMQLEARSVTTGAVAWSWNFTDGGCRDIYPSRCQVIVSNNLVFVTGMERTYAVDLTTHQMVWSYELGGTMSISDSGVLYITATTGGKLVAINLH